MLHGNRMLALAGVAGTLLIMVGLLPAPPASAAAVRTLWNVHCTLSHNAADDPIVYPGQPGKSHMHSFYGNTSTGAASTTTSLTAAGSSCGRGFQQTDHSAYWVPSLYVKHPGAAMTLDTGTPGQQTITVYYRRAGGVGGPKVQPFPAGLRMIAGDHEATGPQPASVTAWGCGNTAALSAGIPTCPAGNYLHGVVHFPSCWDGKNLDSADHKSHMAYAGKHGLCPADHPVSLPAVTFNLQYRDITGGPQYELSSGGQYSMHGDFFAAWDARTQNALVSACINGARDCTGIKRVGDQLTKGTTTIRLADFAPAQAPPAPGAATAATALPKAGAAPLALWALGLAGGSYLLYQHLVRRRRLRAELVRRGRPR